MKMISRVNDIPIRLKFISVYMILILMPMIIVYVIFFTKISDEIKYKENNVIEQSLDRVEADIIYLVTGCLGIARDIAIDHKINEMLDVSYESSVDYYNYYYDDLKDQIQMYASAYNNTIRASIYTDNPTIISGGNVYSIGNAIKDSHWFSTFQKNGLYESVIAWVEPHNIIKERYINRISVIREMKEFGQYGQYKKYVRIDVQESKLNNLLKAEYYMDFIIVNEDGNIITSTLDEESLEDGRYKTFDALGYEEENVIKTRVIEPKEDQRWQLIAIVPKSALIDQISNYGFLTILLFIISIALSMLMIYIFSNSYNMRIKLLHNHMEKVENSQFETINQEVGKDEIGYLIVAFNKMTKRINGLVNEVLKFKLKEKDHQLQQVKAELKFLQSQMDPHFLFNTLNAILVVSNRNKYDEITDIIRYLSKTLRYLIEWDDSMVEISEEIKFTQMYLQIEKFRFRDKFEFNLEMEDNLEGVLVPKMSIQPFVENACKHGIQASKEVGKLLVSVYRLNEFVHIVIKDNGIGMSEERIENIYNASSDSHIGINNVVKRLKINYGESYEFSIKSILGEGTTVIIKIPYTK